MQKFKVYGSKKNVTVEVPNSYTSKEAIKEVKKKAKKEGSGNILQIDSLSECI